MTKVDDGLRPLFHRHLRRVHWQAIETWWMGAGVPDLNGCHKGVEVWIECKRAESERVEVRPGQVAWGEARTRVGGRVFVAVRRHKGKADDLLIFNGAALRLFKDGSRLPDLAPLLFTSGGPARWDWPGIQKILFC